MKRPLGYLSILLAVVAAVAAGAVRGMELGAAGRFDVAVLGFKLLLAVAVVFAVNGTYLLVVRFLVERSPDKRRRHDARNVLRLAAIVTVLVALLGVVTEQWAGLLVSLGVVGFAVTFALQQPLFSLIGWFYIMVKRPYQVGDRVAIEGSKGDIVEIDFFVTTLWEINGELVSSNQPSGRVITVPNSVVLSSHVFNFSSEGFPYVWNELTVQVAYETDLSFARETMAGVADDYLGAEMAERIAEYRELQAETPVEIEVQDRPTVNIVQKESWVELKLRYLVNPRRAQRVRNELYERILARFNESPDRVRFPIGRNR